MKRKLVSLLLVVALCVVQVSPVAAASSLSVEEKLTLIASDMIEVTHLVTESGAMQTTYSNLDVFIAYAQENCDVNDYDLARFVMEYTELNYNERMSDVAVLEVLTYSETTVTHEEISVSGEYGQDTAGSQGIMPVADWYSPDGRMKITTTASIQILESTTYYVLSACATWLVQPSVFERDVLTLTSSAAYDDSYTNWEAYFQHTAYCTSHNHGIGQFLYAYEGHEFDSNETGSLEYVYEGGDPGIKFDTWVLCDQADVYTVDSSQTEITAYLRYRVLMGSEPKNAQAAYAHKTYGIGNISWSVGAEGITPSFSLAGQMDEYFAEPVTLRIT